MELQEIAATQDALAAAQAERSASSGDSSLGAAGSLGQEDFLAMLIAQLENQDPLDPQDASEFTAQLATFSSLDQLIGMRAALDRVAEVTASSERLSTASLVGTEVLAETSTIRIAAGDDAPPELSLELERPVERAVVELVDRFGRIEATAELTTPPAGRQVVDWARFDREPPPGDYSIRVSAGLDGLDATTTLVRDTITGASFETSQPEVLLGGIAIPFASIREINEQ